MHWTVSGVGSSVLSGLTRIAVLGLLLLAALAFYRLFLHPLARIPGPRRAAVSNVWQAYHARNGRMYVLAKALHKEYGHAVRVGPNEVWFDSEEAFQLIYNASSGYEKSSFYLATALNKPRLDGRLRLRSPDTLDLLSERDMRRYRQQRRAIGPLYQAAHLRRYEPAIDAVLARAVAALSALGGEEVVDLREWMHVVVVECLGAACLSWSPGWLRDGSDGGAGQHGQLGWRRKSVFGLFPAAAVAESYSRGLGRAFAAAWGLRYRSPKGFRSFFTGVYRNISKRVAATKSGRKQHDQRRDLTADLVALHRAKPEQFPVPYLHRMAMTNFGAGHETTCSALTAAVAMIASHAAVRDRVAAEVRGGRPPAPPAEPAPDAAGLPAPAARLPYTAAAIKEAQRLWPVIGMSLPRRVPSGGMRAHGHVLPAGTTVGCPPVALHRNPAIFGPDAEAFRPGRWLVGGPEPSGGGEAAPGATDATEAGEAVRRMERHSLTWGGGQRTCPGRNLGEMIVHRAVAALVAGFDVEVVRMPAEEEVRYFFLAQLSGVKARFRPVGDAAEKAGGRKSR